MEKTPCGCGSPEKCPGCCTRCGGPLPPCEVGWSPVLCPWEEYHLCNVCAAITPTAYPRTWLIPTEDGGTIEISIHDQEKEVTVQRVDKDGCLISHATWAGVAGPALEYEK